ncbi:(2Fe-2S)-binding protein [Fibrella sp. HMF5335]|uniref:(2Fe-2S)-binding protein n=1 Tax=Fibrella rubiginis TaxID=2817060 RepID=A0A939GKT9_9BACT|nr:(2Fe-2S)-binding protein [Fibrella rubiginis]MBO0939119.1 (2Fe-2S)-binding protein [Fibrella rubiginis]
MIAETRSKPAGRSPLQTAAPAKPLPGVEPGSVTLTVNGQAKTIQIAPWTTLLDALREYMNLTGTKKGCDHGQCGACTVLVDGKRINACLTLAVMHDDHAITTIEGLASPDGGLHPVQQAFIDHDAFQCGYCTPGQICSAVGMLHEGHAKNKADVREGMSGNICRCGAYPHIVDAVLEVINKAEKQP